MKAVKCNKCDWINCETEMSNGSLYLPAVCERCGIFLGHFEDNFEAVDGTLIAVPYEPERGHSFVGSFCDQIEKGLTVNIGPAVLRVLTSRWQITVLVCSLTAFALLGLFPPWVAAYGLEGRLTSPIGPHWLFSQPGSDYPRVDLQSLLILWTVCAVIGLAAYWLVSLIPTSKQKRLILQTKITDFRGWQHGRIFRLSTGEWWQQVSGENEPENPDTHRIEQIEQNNPETFIVVTPARLYRAGAVHYLDADGMLQPVEVRRIG